MIGCNDEFAASPMRYMLILTQTVKEHFSFDTQPGLERIPGVVNAGMDHFAVATAGLLPEFRVFLEHKHIVEMIGKFGGNS